MRKIINTLFTLALIFTILTPINSTPSVSSSEVLTQTVESTGLLGAVSQIVDTITITQLRGYIAQLTWNTVEGAIAYHIYRNDGITSGYLGESTTTSYQDPTVTAGTTYFYSIAPVFEGDVEGTMSKAVAKYIVNQEQVYTPANLKGFYDEAGVHLTWNYDWLADEYTIERKDPVSASFKTIATITASDPARYLDTTAVLGNHYEYRIIARRTLTNGQVIAVTGVSAGVDTLLGLYIPDFFMIPQARFIDVYTFADYPRLLEVEVWTSTSFNGTYRRVLNLFTKESILPIVGGSFDADWYNPVYVQVRGRYTFRYQTFYSNFSDPISIKPTLAVRNVEVWTSGIMNTVYWDDNGADGYYVYYSDDGVDYSLLAITSSPSYDHWGLTLNETGYYKIQAFMNLDSVFLTSPISDPVFFTVLPPYQFAAAEFNDRTSVTLAWDDLDTFQVDGYVISRSSDNVTYAFVGEYDRDVQQVTLTGINPNALYSYRIQAYVDIHGVRYYSQFQDEPIIPMVKSTQLISGDFSTLGYSLFWNPVTGADGYIIMRAQENMFFSYIPIGDVTTNSFIDTNSLTENYSNVFYYRVVPYYEYNGVRVYGSMSNTLSYDKNEPYIYIRGEADYNSVWLGISGSNLVGYELTRATSYTGARTFVYNGLFNHKSEVYYTNTGLGFNVQYLYYVRGYYYVNGVKTYTAENGVMLKTNLKAPVITVKPVSPTSINISWLPVAGATNYTVILSSEFSSKKLATITTTSYTVTGLTPENLYEFAVVANRVVNGVTYVGESSGARPEFATLPHVTNLKATPSFDTLNVTWSKVTGASGYYIFVTNMDTGSVRTVDVGTSIAFIADNLDPNTSYAVMIWPYYYSNGYQEYGYISDPLIVSTRFNTPVLTGRALSQTSVELNWTAVDGASSYSLYMKNLETGRYEFYVETTDRSVSIGNLPIGVPQYFRVRANRETQYGQVISAYGSVSVTPALTAPVNLHLTGFNTDALNIAFSGNLDATGYEIFRSATLTGTYVKIATVTATEYQNSGLAFNTSYFYKIRAYLDYEGGTTYSDYSSVFTAKTALNVPTNLTVLSTNYNTVKASWAAVSGASGYEVYRSLNYGTYALVTTTTALSVTHTGLLTGNQYTYKIRAYRLVGTVKVYGAFTDPIGDGTRCSTPVITAASYGYNSVIVTWPAVPGATEYAIEYTVDNFSSNTLSYVTVKTNSAILRGLTTNKPIYIRAIAYYVNGVLHSGSYTSEVIQATPIPSAPALTGQSMDYQSVKATWTAVDGATGYELYKLTPGTEEYEMVLDTTNLSLTEIELTTGSQHSYKVRAYIVINDQKVYGPYSLVLTLSPVPSVVTGLNINTPKYNELTLSWNAVTGATGYEITRSTTATGAYSLVAEVDGALTYIQTGLAFNTTYFYKIRPYTTVNEIKFYGLSSAAVSAKTTLETVLTPKAVYTSYNSNQITWSPVNGATGYEVYRSIGTSTTYALAGTVAVTTFNNTLLLTNTRYNYKIRAYRLVGTLKIYGAFSSIVSSTPLPLAPVVTVISSAYNGLKVNWPVVGGANGYEVSYATSETGTYTKLALLTTNSASIANLLTNTTYYVKVRAYRIVNYVKIYGTYSVIKTGTPVPATPVVTAISTGFNSVKLTWLAITGANGYEIYMLSPESSDYYLVDDVTVLTSTVTRLMTGSTYNFKVKAYRLVNSVRVYGLESAVKPATPIPSLVTGFKVAMPSVTSLKLSWTGVAGATGYEVFKSTALAGTYVSLGFIEGVTEFTVTGLTFNTSTYYKIRAYTTMGEMKVNGATSAALTGKTMPSTVVLTVANTSYTSNTLSWSAIEGATGYEIYYSSGTSTYYTLLKSLTALSFTHTPLVFNTQYNYKVRAYKLVGTVKYYGAYSTLTSIKTAVSAPKAVVSSTHDSIGLTWALVAGASGYEVSISTSLTGPYTVTTQTTLSKTFSALTTGTTYYIKLRSYRLISTTKVYGQYSGVITVTPALAVPSAQLTELTSTTATFSWAAVDGATDYEVRIISDAVGAEWFVESVSELTVTFSDLDPSAHYTVEIRAVKKIGEVPFYSDYSGDVIFSYSDTM